MPSSKTKADVLHASQLPREVIMPASARGHRIREKQVEAQRQAVQPHPTHSLAAACGENSLARVDQLDVILFTALFTAVTTVINYGSSLDILTIYRCKGNPGAGPRRPQSLIEVCLLCAVILSLHCNGCTKHLLNMVQLSGSHMATMVTESWIYSFE